MVACGVGREAGRVQYEDLLALAGRAERLTALPVGYRPLRSRPLDEPLPGSTGSDRCFEIGTPGRATARAAGGVGARVLHTYPLVMVVAAMVPLLGVHAFMRNRRLESVIGRMPLWLFALIWAALLFFIIITQGSGDAFIYFQF